MPLDVLTRFYPFAKSRKYEVKTTKKLSEDAFYKDKDKSIEYVHDLLKEEKSILVCSHNPNNSPNS